MLISQEKCSSLAFSIHFSFSAYKEAKISVSVGGVIRKKMGVACFEKIRWRYRLKHCPVLWSSLKMSLGPASSSPSWVWTWVPCPTCIAALSPGSGVSIRAIQRHQSTLLWSSSSAVSALTVALFRCLPSGLNSACAQSPLLSDPSTYLALTLNQQKKRALCST